MTLSAAVIGHHRQAQTRRSGGASLGFLVQSVLTSKLPRLRPLALVASRRIQGDRPDTVTTPRVSGVRGKVSCRSGTGELRPPVIGGARNPFAGPGVAPQAAPNQVSGVVRPCVHPWYEVRNA